MMKFHVRRMIVGSLTYVQIDVVRKRTAIPTSDLGADRQLPAQVLPKI